MLWADPVGADAVLVPDREVIVLVQDQAVDVPAPAGRVERIVASVE
jgi:hypothetical protein